MSFFLYNSEYDDFNSKCHTCKKNKNKCSCKLNLYSCDLCLLKDECIEKIDSRCTIYNLNEDNSKSKLQCLGILSNTSIHDIVEKISDKLCNEIDEKVKVSDNDTTLGYLYDKIVLGECLQKTIQNQNGDERLFISIDMNCLCNKIEYCGLLTPLLVLVPILTLISSNLCSKVLYWNYPIVTCNQNQTTTVSISVSGNTGSQVEFYDYSLLGNVLYNPNGWVDGNSLNGYTSLTVFLSNGSIIYFKARIKGCTNYIDGSVTTCFLVLTLQPILTLTLTLVPTLVLTPVLTLVLLLIGTCELLIDLNII